MVRVGRVGINHVRPIMTLTLTLPRTLTLNLTLTLTLTLITRTSTLTLTLIVRLVEPLAAPRCRKPCRMHLLQMFCNAADRVSQAISENWMGKISQARCQAIFGMRMCKRSQVSFQARWAFTCLT